MEQSPINPENNGENQLLSDIIGLKSFFEKGKPDQMRTLDECLKHTIASVNIQKINKIAFETISKYETPEGYSSMLREIQKEDPSIEKITIGNIFMDICQNVRDNDIGYISNDEGIVLQQALESVIISRTSKFTSEYPEIYLDIDGGGIINEDDVRISVGVSLMSTVNLSPTEKYTEQFIVGIDSFGPGDLSDSFGNINDAHDFDHAANKVTSLFARRQYEKTIIDEYERKNKISGKIGNYERFIEMKEKEFPLAIAVALMSRYGLDADGNISKSELEFYTKDATEADFASVVDLMVDQNKRRAAGVKIDQATINGETTIIVRGPNSQHEEFQVSGSDIEGFVRQVSDILEYCHNTYDILKESYAEEANMVE